MSNFGKRARVGNCLVCNAEFDAVNDFSTEKGTRYQKYCSKGCWSKRVGKIDKNCLSCNETFSSYQSQNKVYCNNECRNTHYRDRFKGSNSHTWKGGVTTNNEKIRSCADAMSWKKAVRSRDDDQCKLCNSKKDLHCHHIIGFAEDESKRFDVDNGITVCCTCHSILHGKNIGRANMELFKDPKYCDVIVNRMHKLYPDLPIKLNGEEWVNE